jgi:hypothetical protein
VFVVLVLIAENVNRDLLDDGLGWALIEVFVSEDGNFGLGKIC